MSVDGSSPAPADPRLAAVLAELVGREPIFHRPEHARTRADFERMTEPTFREVGASGRRYSREFVLAELDRRLASGLPDPPWLAREFEIEELAPALYLLTYTLEQGARVTRRSTLWRRSADGWKIVFHQGTIVAAP